MTAHYCSTCGTANWPFARFCEACGSRLRGPIGVTCARCGAIALPGERFCDECGTRLPPTALLILEESGWRVPLPSTADRPEIIVGREDKLSGVVPDVDLGSYGAESLGVSRRHVRLVRGAIGYRAEDLGSVNLTYVNDQRLEPGRAIELKDGDRITIGRLAVFFRVV
jgi:hypothetical protein